MKSQERVPDELWLEIFKNIAPDTLKHVFSTNRSFYRVSRPLLFAEFNFHGVSIDVLERNGGIVLEDDYHFQRLNFWASDDVAPLVRSCNLAPATTVHFSQLGPPYTVLDAIFERFSRFIFLRRIHATEIPFTQKGVASLCSLPALTHLELDFCFVPPGETINISLELPVSSMRIYIDRRMKTKLDHWIPLLHRDHLHELDVTCHPRLIFQAITGMPSFPHLHTLSLTMDPGKVSQNLEILAKFPALRVFRLHGYEGPDAAPGPRVQASGILPMLTEYTGPCQTVHTFLHLPSLTRLTTDICSPSDFLAQLEGQSNITSLSVTFTDLDIASFGPMCALFPCLTELRIQVTVFMEEEDVDELEDGVNHKAADFFSALADDTCVPPTLQHLALCWEFRYFAIEKEDTPTGGDVPDLGALRGALVARCPGLQSLWLDGNDFLLYWRALGENHIVEGAEGVQALRPEFSAFWDTRYESVSRTTEGWDESLGLRGASSWSTEYVRTGIPGSPT
ncbi:hypothetical protein C8R43DRAFT_1007644 [Mycena crocata]|nr:hypothetical protein C8R43DRAFT_1007644 [Mycena crocata]